MADPEAIFKGRDITETTKIHIDRVLVCPAVTDGYENWILRKAE